MSPCSGWVGVEQHPRVVLLALPGHVDHSTTGILSASKSRKNFSPPRLPYTRMEFRVTIFDPDPLHRITSLPATRASIGRAIAAGRQQARHAPACTDFLLSRDCAGPRAGEPAATPSPSVRPGGLYRATILNIRTPPILVKFFCRAGQNCLESLRK